MEGGELFVPSRSVHLVNLECPWKRGGCAKKFLVEVVAPSTDRLSQHDARCDCIGKGWQQNAPSSGGNPGAECA